MEKHIKDLQKENELLIAQLHKVQEELEGYFLKCQQLKLQNTNLIKKQKGGRCLNFSNLTILIKKAFIGRLKSLGLITMEEYGNIDIDDEQIYLIKNSGLFDESWYLLEYPDVASSKMRPIEHYIKFGADEGRNPSAYFNTLNYLRYNPKLKENNLNPLSHFIEKEMMRIDE